MTERSPETGLRLDNPLVVQWEYASEERLVERMRTYRRIAEGTQADQVAFDAVREAAPRRVLDVGCGTGEFAARVAGELGVEVIAVDLSPRMVALAGERGVDARVGDVQALAFGDGEFDCAVVNWVLYHVPDVEAGVRELARVLRPGGRLVAATVSRSDLSELWDLLAAPLQRELTFDDANGAHVLETYFARVERREATGTIVFENREEMSQFVAVTITQAHLADRVPELSEPFRATTRHIVYVADKR